MKTLSKLNVVFAVLALTTVTVNCKCDESSFFKLLSDQIC